MKKSRAFAAGAVLALALGAAACGDDDDDASGGTTALTAAANDSGTEPADAATTPAEDGTATTSASEDTAGGTEATVASVSVPEDVAADCEAFTELGASLSTVETPEVGDEISDEYRDSLHEAIDALEGLDLESDEGKDARDSLVDDLNTAADADTWTEELQALGSSEEMVTFGTMCASQLSGG